MNVYHIGYHKTGNTWINNVLLPMARPMLHAHGTRVRCNEGLSGSLLRDDVDYPKKLAEQDSNARVVITIRSQTNMLPSLYWLYVKSGGELRFEHYVADVIENGKLRYDILAAAYVDVFGPDNVLVLAYELLRTNPAGFLAKVESFWGLPPDCLPVGAVGRRANPSPSHGFVEVTRRANAVLHPKSKVAFLLRRMPQFLWLAVEKPFAINNRRGLYHRDERAVMARIEKAYAAPNQMLTGIVPVDLSGHGYPGVP